MINTKAVFNSPVGHRSLTHPLARTREGSESEVRRIVEWVYASLREEHGWVVTGVSWRVR